MNRALRWTLGFGLAAAALVYVATGWVVVAPGEAVVVRRFGRLLPEPWTAGPHWGLPIGLDRRIRIRTDAVERVEVGLAGIPGPDDAPATGEFLTGDLNLLRARAIVQYRVADPVALVLHADQVDALVARMAESSLTRAFSHRGIDAALRAGRIELAQATADDLARSIERYGLGLSILGVSLTDARPPAEVQPDFDAAQAALSLRDQRLNEARSYAATTVRSAQSAAGAKIEAARAQSNRAIELARARALRFTNLLAEANRSRRLTVRRLYLDALQEFLPRLKRKVLMTPEEPVDLGIIGNTP
jgi:membrane protease subunit HflK